MADDFHKASSLPECIAVVSGKDRVFHICLAGQAVSNDWPLIHRLKAQHQVTVVERVRLLSRNSILDKVDVLVLDCSESHGLGLKILPFLKKYFPELCIVLVDGGLTQPQIAAAFRQGARDYFSEPYDLSLLVERVDALGATARGKEGTYFRELISG
jgi:DNA-binding NtrC family response regulator